MKVSIWYCIISQNHEEHEGHIVSEADFFSHQRVRKVNIEEEDLVKQLSEAYPSNIAKVLNKKTRKGNTYDGQFIRNLKAKFAKTKGAIVSVEEALRDIMAGYQKLLEIQVPLTCPRGPGRPKEKRLGAPGRKLATNRAAECRRAKRRHF